MTFFLTKEKLVGDEVGLSILDALDLCTNCSADSLKAGGGLSVEVQALDNDRAGVDVLWGAGGV